MKAQQSIDEAFSRLGWSRTKADADEIADLEKAYALLFAENAKWRALAEAAPAELEAYDAGLLSDFGGGNVEWWQDYIRAELGRAHDFYQSQLGSQA